MTCILLSMRNRQRHKADSILQSDNVSRRVVGGGAIALLLVEASSCDAKLVNHHLRNPILVLSVHEHLHFGRGVHCSLVQSSLLVLGASAWGYTGGAELF